MQLAQSPILGGYPAIIGFLVIFVELVTAILLIFRGSRLLGLYGALGIMSVFSVYIYLIVNYSESIPCSCGGILERMDWNTHLLFNLFCVIMATAAIATKPKGNKQKILGLSAMIILTPGLLLTLFFFLQTIDKQGNFTRKIMSPLQTEYKTISLTNESYYFAGNHGDTLFLANRKTPLLLSTITPHFQMVKIDKIKLDNYKHKFVSVTINIKYPHFSISDGKVPAVFEGRLPSLKAYDCGINRLYFSRFYMLEPNRYVFKTMLIKTKENELGILNTATKKYSIFPDVLQSKVDGIFDTDGDMVIDRKNKKIIYTHFYRNEIITTDFELKDIQRHQTVDSLSNSSIETKTLSNGQTKLVKSPSVINRVQTVSGNRFYNVSRRRGRNESFLDFRNKITIDVYDTDSKKYLHSFYIINNNRTKIKNILSTKHYLYVLSGNKIIRYAYK
ncbi:hypothetical protein LUD75_13670 [Epilithonimonas sp. JDS]|nr:MauE/DoxX family redox-associated membrane protein [Epilithonimonas sp. JDS]MCD9855767.1 hypothetical protein [Epilithonimonas sp. JDS]